MTLFDNIVFKTPVLRVNNRDLNIAFYQKNLGLRLVSEENAISIFSSWGQGQERFVIEESPAARTRAVDGPKKVNTIVIKTTAPKDIEQLLAHGVDYDLIFKGKKAMPLKSPHQREIASYSMQRTISRSLTLLMMFLQLTRKLTLEG